MIFLSSLIEYFTLKDVIDVLIVAFLFYQVMMVIYGTRAVQMLIGVGALGVLFYFGIQYKLYAVNWILSHFFGSFFLIFVIIFQDQIRLGLASVATGKKIWRSKEDEALMKEIDEIVDAAERLSREHIGALIVFERQNGLMNYVETGTLLEGRIHSDLIYAIFDSSSSLHDGAVIISKSRIKAAGCFLPLSKNSDVDRQMGTRHRAALGLTELTDAVVLVVSEETGKIHLGVGGALIYCKSGSDLRMQLQNLSELDFRSLSTKSAM